ncbi:MAG: S9 family peptidase [Deltaproteobacteria bacterium]
MPRTLRPWMPPLGLALTLAASAGCAAVSANARCHPPSTSDLEAEPELVAYVATRGYRLGQPASPRVTPDGARVLYLESGPRSDVRSLWVFEVATGKARVLATGEGLAGAADQTLTRKEAALRERLRLTARGIGSFQLSNDGRAALVPFGGRLYLVDVATGRATPLSPGAGPDFDPRLSPDGRFVASVENDELYVRDVRGGAPVRLTHGASATVTHGSAEFVAEEEMDRFHGFWWSPDSSALAFEEADSAAVERFFLVDAAHPETAPEGSPYPRPGKANVSVRLGIVSRSGGEPRFVRWDRERFPYLARVLWPKGGPLLLEVQSRDQHDLLLLAADPNSGATHRLVAEHDDAWVNLNDDLRWLPERQALLWSSERSGQNELELRSADGKLVRELTLPGQGFRRLVSVDEKAGLAVVEGGSRSSEQSLWQISLDGAPAKRLAGGAEFHSAVAGEAMERAPVLVDHVARLGGPARTDLLSAVDGARLGELPSQAERPAALPQVEPEQLELPGATLEAELVLPKGFDPHRRYPVIDWVYGGPGVVSVERAAESNTLQQWIADRGFVVVRVDNRGTPHRSRAFERILAGSLAAVPLGDQALALQALGREHPFMDLSRVGAIGASFGGYLSALAVLRRPEVFRAAVAIAPVVDWQDYDTHYTERYLGLPDANAAGYRESSLLTGAETLSRPLLLAHGTADDNVHFVGTLKLIEALERAGVAPELYLVPGQTHLFADQATQRLLWARSVAFLEEALGVSASDR